MKMISIWLILKPSKYYNGFLFGAMYSLETIIQWFPISNSNAFVSADWASGVPLWIITVSQHCPAVIDIRYVLWKPI